MSRSLLIPLLGFGLGVLSLSFGVGREIRVPVGGGRGPLLVSNLGPSEAALDLPDAEVADSRHDFYFRQIEGPTIRVAIPLLPTGDFSVAARIDSTVRTKAVISWEGGHAAAPESFITTGPWRDTEIATGVQADETSFTLTLEDAPLVRRSDTETFRRYIDELVLRSDTSFKLPWMSRLAGGALVFLLVALALRTQSRVAAWVVAISAPTFLAWLSSVDPVALSLATPRLLATVLLTVLLIAGVTRRLRLRHQDAVVVSLLAYSVAFGCGYLSFLPNHSPADLDIHIWRTVDLADVPMTYEAWMRYGSHYPTHSQIRGSATEALGEGPAIPYSPLPYVFFYAAHAAGLDLHWSMNAIEAMGLALLLPFVFAFAQTSSSAFGGLLASTLMALDLATIHHLGRAHSPAVLGGALGLAALIAVGLSVPTIDQTNHWKMPALLLGLGALGYSSTPLFYALFGVALLALLATRREARHLLRSVLLTFAVGGALALVLFYGHYIPGLIGGSSNSALMIDPFPGRTFFIFHNESRQSLRLWKMGLFIPMLAAIPAAFVVFKRCSAAIASFLLAWVAAWAGVMMLKEPWALPRLLRWAKEDFYVAPAMALLIGIAIARIESRTLRNTLAFVSVMVALYLRVGDYGFHVDTLRFMK